MTTTNPVENHYGVGGILDSILKALSDMGKDVHQLTPIDLAPVDEFHIRGRDATIELARRASLTARMHILDVGCGLGGSARYLATEYQCQVTGVDLTQEYIDVANALAKLVGLQEVVKFRQANALELPFNDQAFDIVWTEHVQMNIADKHGFYSEIARVLKPGGRLVFHDIFQGTGGEPHYPVPWAEERSISTLAPIANMKDILEGAGLLVLDWADRSGHSIEWFQNMVEKMQNAGPPSLGLHLLTGKTAKEKFANVLRNLKEKRIVVFQGVTGSRAERPAPGRGLAGS